MTLKYSERDCGCLYSSTLSYIFACSSELQLINANCTFLVVKRILATSIDIHPHSSYNKRFSLAKKKCPQINMPRNSQPSHRLPLIFLLIAIGAHFVNCDAESPASPEHRSADESVLDLSYTKIKARSEDKSKISSKAIPEISLNLETKPRVKSDEAPNRSPASPTSMRPMVSPRYRVPPRNLAPASTKDSYLDALHYSHNIKDPRGHENKPPKLTRREYTPGPVYRPETDNSASSSNQIGTFAYYFFSSNLFYNSSMRFQKLLQRSRGSHTAAAPPSDLPTPSGPRPRSPCPTSRTSPSAPNSTTTTT